MNKELATKWLKAQKEIEAIKKDSKNPFYKSNYFDINALLAAIKPVLNKHGLIISQPLTYIDHPNGVRIALKTVIADADTGETYSETTIIPWNDDAQKLGAIITYFRRYAWQSFLSLEAEDDDGNTASGKITKNNDVPF